MSAKPKQPSGLTPEQLADIERSGRISNVKIALLKLGVGRSHILDLVEHYSLERIERQLNWLPLRRARKPSSLIVSAIKEDYEEPAAALEQATADSSSSDYRDQESND